MGDPPAAAGGRRVFGGVALHVTLPTIPDLATRIADVEKRLIEPDLAAANTKFEPLRTNHPKKQRPHWHKLFGGPGTIEDLPNEVGFAGHEGRADAITFAIHARGSTASTALLPGNASRGCSSSRRRRIFFDPHR